MQTFVFCFGSSSPRDERSSGKEILNLAIDLGKLFFFGLFHNNWIKGSDWCGRRRMRKREESRRRPRRKLASLLLLLNFMILLEVDPGCTSLNTNKTTIAFASQTQEDACSSTPTHRRSSRTVESAMMKKTRESTNTKPRPLRFLSASQSQSRVGQSNCVCGEHGRRRFPNSACPQF